MAGIGIKLNRIYDKHSIAADIYGATYSTAVTIAPMLLVIAVLVLMESVFGFADVSYYDRELFSCTVLYVFIFALLTASPFNAVLSRYMSDVIYKEQYEDILPCYYVGLGLNVTLSILLGIPFCLHEYFVGQVDVMYVFTGYFCYVSLVLVFYTMLFLSICKSYGKISKFFLIGMATTFILAWIMIEWLGWPTTFSMLIALAVGFVLTAALEMALVRSYFRENSHKYRPVLHYFRKYWQLVGINFLYTLGLYIHNFVFWTTDMRMELVRSFICNQPYDMASCLAMFTNISASVIFIARVEMNFHDRYKYYSDAVTGGRRIDIEISKSRMFYQMAEEVQNLVRVQFIVSVIVFLLGIVLLPRLGFAGLVMRIYPCLSAGYFIMFLMYSTIIFLYYFNDLNGALAVSGCFCLGTLVFSIISTYLNPIWYGLGLTCGAMIGWCVSYSRFRWLQKNLDMHIFCSGHVIEGGKGKRPSGKVFDRRAIHQERRTENV